MRDQPDKVPFPKWSTTSITGIVIATAAGFVLHWIITPLLACLALAVTAVVVFRHQLIRVRMRDSFIRMKQDRNGWHDPNVQELCPHCRCYRDPRQDPV